MDVAFKIVLVTLIAMSPIASISEIGEERKPRTKGSAAASVVLNGLIIAGILYWL